MGANKPNSKISCFNGAVERVTCRGRRRRGVGGLFVLFIRPTRVLDSFVGCGLRTLFLSERLPKDSQGFFDTLILLKLLLLLLLLRCFTQIFSTWAKYEANIYLCTLCVCLCVCMCMCENIGLFVFSVKDVSRSSLGRE